MILRLEKEATALNDQRSSGHTATPLDGRANLIAGGCDKNQPKFTTLHQHVFITGDMIVNVTDTRDSVAGRKCWLLVDGILNTNTQ